MTASPGPPGPARGSPRRPAREAPPDPSSGAPPRRRRPIVALERPMPGGRLEVGRTGGGRLPNDELGPEHATACGPASGGLAAVDLGIAFGSAHRTDRQADRRGSHLGYW